MATIVGVQTEDGAVLAGDRLLVQGGTVRSEDKRHVFDLGEAGAAAVGESGVVDEFHRRLESKVQSHEVEADEPMGLTRLANVASGLADDEGVEAVVAGREDGTAGLRGIGSDGSILTDDVVVLGSGAQVALGVLESREEGLGLADAEEVARDAVETASDRDIDTGGEVDTYRLADE